MKTFITTKGAEWEKTKVRKIFIISLTILVLIYSLVACTAKESEVEANVLDIKPIHEAIKENFRDDYLPDTSLTLEELVELTGVEKDSIDEFIAEVSKNENTVDTFIAINTKRDTSYDAAQKFLKYKEKLDEDALKHPDNIAKIKASKVVRKGDTVFFIMIGKPNTIENQESKEAIDFSEKEVKRVEAVINEVCG